MDFGNLKQGDAFKLSENGKLIYTKTNDKEGQCTTEKFGAIFGRDHKVYPTQHGP